MASEDYIELKLIASLMAMYGRDELTMTLGELDKVFSLYAPVVSTTFDGRVFVHLLRR